MKMRRAGQRRHFVALQSKVDTATTTGFTSEWTTYVEAWAAVEPVSGGATERPVAHTTQTPATHLVELDYDARATTQHRVLFDGRALYIVNPPQNVEERSRAMVLACEERAA